MIKLYQFPPAWGLPNVSPFCMKVETYLRMASLPYECPRRADIRRAPKGKFPYIEDQGRRIADSGLIVEYLVATYGDKLDAELSAAQRAAALAIRRLLEEHLYWAMIHDRWEVRAHWQQTRRDFFGFLPPLVRRLLPPLIRKKVLAQLYGHGMGRHRSEEIYALGKADIDALAGLLGDQSFFLGESPSSLDASAYAFIANLMATPFDSPLKAATRSHSKLVSYAQRMRERYFSAPT